MVSDGLRKLLGLAELTLCPVKCSDRCCLARTEKVEIGYRLEILAVVHITNKNKVM